MNVPWSRRKQHCGRLRWEGWGDLDAEFHGRAIHLRDRNQNYSAARLDDGTVEIAEQPVDLVITLVHVASVALSVHFDASQRKRQSQSLKWQQCQQTFKSTGVSLTSTQDLICAEVIRFDEWIYFWNISRPLRPLQCYLDF